MIGQTVREVLEGKVVLDIEGIDRLYLNLYQPMLQTGGGVATFFKGHRGAKQGYRIKVLSITDAPA